MGRGNMANCLRYFPTQALNFAFKDKIKAQFKPSKTDPNLTKLGKNVAAGGAAGAMSLMFVYSLDYARTRLTNDNKSAKKGGERQFNGLVDVYKKPWPQTVSQGFTEVSAFLVLVSSFTEVFISVFMILS